MWCREKQVCGPGALAGRDGGSSYSLSAPSRAFTLIELLVVISIVALLMAILLPTLGRAGKQAKAVGCQANLRQWGLIAAAYAAENDGRLACGDQPRESGDWEGAWHAHYYAAWAAIDPDHPQRFKALRRIACCPMATRTAVPPESPIPSDAPPGGPPPGVASWGAPIGGTFRAWGYPEPHPDSWWYGSYATNLWVLPSKRPDGAGPYERYWPTANARNAEGVPVQLDSCVWLDGMWSAQQVPPVCDAVPTRSQAGSGADSFCINRHDGRINSMFLDWSVRKVGLKELWTLRWHRQFDIRGAWTKAGGVQAEDWPAWMRGFKDY